MLRMGERTHQPTGLSETSMAPDSSDQTHSLDSPTTR